MSTYCIRLDASTCECAEWQMLGIPCGHALAVSLELGTDSQIFAKPFYTIAAYRQTYATAIFPPNVHRQAGRPRKVRIRGGTEGSDRENLGSNTLRIWDLCEWTFEDLLPSNEEHCNEDS